MALMQLSQTWHHISCFVLLFDARFSTVFRHLIPVSGLLCLFPMSSYGQSTRHILILPSQSLSIPHCKSSVSRNRRCSCSLLQTRIHFTAFAFTPTLIPHGRLFAPLPGACSCSHIFQTKFISARRPMSYPCSRIRECHRLFVPPPFHME
jgi:hypothetical protein